jgi:hypothetical protein
LLWLGHGKTVPMPLCPASYAGGGKVYTYVCRCGDVYALNPDDDELCELEAVVVPCSSCSNHILVRLHRQPPGVD